MNRVAVFPGSFDPFTLAHLDILEQAIKVFDKVIVLVSYNSAKANGMFLLKERIEIIKRTLENKQFYNKTNIDKCTTTVVDYCNEHNYNFIVRGIRYSNAAEEIALGNIYHEDSKHDNTIIPVYFTSLNKQYENISSTRVREYLRYNNLNWCNCIDENVHAYIFKNY